MQTLRVALAQVNSTIGDFEGNRAKILEAAHRADKYGADVIAFPELVITGYPPEDQLLRPAFIQEAEQHLQTGMLYLFPQAPQPLPRVLVQEPDACIKGGSSPYLERKKPHFIKLRRDRDHVSGAHPSSYE